MPGIRRICRLLAWSLRTWTILLVTAIVLSPAAASSEPHWIRVDSSHFSVLTDGDEKHGHEVAARFEQMRAVFAQLLMKSRVNIPQPIDIIAFKADGEYELGAPSRQGSGLGSGFFIPGEDRSYFVLNLSHEESWRAVTSDFARLLLGSNYPPTQAWFDQGFIEYFSGLDLTDSQMRIGGDPNGSSVALLNRSNWLGVARLFSENPDRLDETERTLFRAQSWIVVDYLLEKEQLPAVGTYFGYVENEKLAVNDAVQKAFGMSSAQLEQAVKDHFRSLSAEAKAANARGGARQQAPAPVTADMIGTSTHQLPAAEAQALVAEMKLRLPDRRQEARKELAAIIDQPNTENAIAHRALGWDLIEQKQYDRAGEELGKAMALDGKDPWTHYYLAILKFQDAQSKGREMRGLANMMQDLHVVLDWDHEFAEAYHLLALAQIEGGGLRAASASIQAAIERAPRKPGYLLDLVRIYEDGKNWDAATALLERLSANSDPEIANAAQKELHDLPYIQKYGIPPLSGSPSQPTGNAPATLAGSSNMAPAKGNSTPGASAERSPASPAESEEANGEESLPIPAPQIDRRPIQYRKGTLISVDCSRAPAAIVAVSIGGKTVRLRTADYRGLMLIGADSFSCDWTNRSVSVNYRPGGQADGDLVSLEVH